MVKSSRKSYDHFHVDSVTSLDVYKRCELLKQLGARSATGFYIHYFNDLPYHRNQTECFQHVNTLYFDLFGEYRFSDYNSFRCSFRRDYLRKTDKK